MARGKPWNAAENQAIVADYLEMLCAELEGAKYNKTEHRAALARILNGRSDGSIELKHQNISAVMLELGLPYIDGYKPRSNYQAALFDRVRLVMKTDAALDRVLASDIQAVPEIRNAESLAQITVPVPEDIRKEKVAISSKRTNASKTNYLVQEARNRRLGLLGEEFVLKLEIDSLLSVGEEELAQDVEHVSITQGDGLGYDIASFEPDGREKFIEVKTTKYGIYTPFYVSRNEVLISEAISSNYHLYRLFVFRKSPKLYVLNGALENNCALTAESYRAWPS